VIELSRVLPQRSLSEARRALSRAIESVSCHLGNTVSICRKCYIYPAVIQAHLDGSLQSVYASELARARRCHTPGLSAEEVAVLACLKRWARVRERLAA